jgi:hypothetical protein
MTVGKWVNVTIEAEVGIWAQIRSHRAAKTSTYGFPSLPKIW